MIRLLKKHWNSIVVDIEILKKILGSFRITEEYTSDGNRTIKLISEEILTALVVHNKII